MINIMKISLNNTFKKVKLEFLQGKFNYLTGELVRTKIEIEESYSKDFKVTKKLLEKKIKINQKLTEVTYNIVDLLNE